MPAAAMGGKKKSKQSPALGDAGAASQAFVKTLRDAPADTLRLAEAAKAVHAAAAAEPSGSASYLAVCMLHAGVDHA